MLIVVEKLAYPVSTGIKNADVLCCIGATSSEFFYMYQELSRLFLLALTFVTATSTYAQDTLQQIQFSVDQYLITGDNPIGDEANEILVPFLGEQYGLEGLSAAADALEQAVIAAGFSFHRVTLPPQELLTGTVSLQVSRFTVGSIKIEGNQFFNEQNILHSIPELKEGQTPNTQYLSRSVKIANTHTAKDITLKFKQGEAPDTIDASLNVADSDPQLIYVTLDNTGSETTELYRTTLGYQHSNLFNVDHSITATLTTAPEDTNTLAQYGLNYHIPFYGHGGSLDILLSDSQVNSGTVASSIEISGKGSVYGMVYNKAILTDGKTSHGVSAGFQYKVFDNSLTVGSFQSESKVLSSPLELSYSFTRSSQGASISGALTFAGNIPGGSDADLADYEFVRPGADNQWASVRYSFSYNQLVFGEWLLHGRVSGQSSDDLLIPGEQFGVGGSTSQRGFEERSITGDKGYQGSFELWLPPLTSQKIRFLIFYDTATLEFNDTTAVSSDFASSGLGMRWSWKKNFNLTLDYGKIIRGGGSDPTINKNGDDKAHFNMVYRF
jgi:hemolysin activation/secretion protein